MTRTPHDLTKYQRHYSQETFLQKLMKLARKAGEKVVYLALVLYFELLDPDVPVKAKAVLIGALGYLMLPVDLIPDFIPLMGFADDFSALVAAYKIVQGNITENVKNNAERTMLEWFGDVDIQSIDDQVTQAAEENLDDKD